MAHIMKEERNSFGVNFLSGGFATMHPIDSLKVRLQTHQPVVVGNLFRGIFTSALFSFPQGGLRLASYEFTKRQMSFNDAVSTPSVGHVILSALVGDLCSSIVKVPREIVTTKIQSCSNSSALQISLQIYKRHGIPGFFEGYWSSACRDSPFMVILFALYEQVKRSKICPEDSWWLVFGAGTSGFLAAFVTTPFDNIKTVIITQHLERPRVSSAVVAEVPIAMDRNLTKAALRNYSISAAKNVKVKGTISIVCAARKIYERRGVSGFYVGAVPRSVWWFAVCSIFFPVYEHAQNILSL